MFAETEVYMVCRFDPHTNRWFNDVMPMRTARAFAGVTVHDGVIYVVGGMRADGNYLNTVEK